MVRREVRIERDVEQPALVAGVDRGQSGDGFRQLPVLTDDAQPSRLLLGDENAAVGKKRHAPRKLQPSATVTTSKATFDVRTGARVCPGNAGR